MGLLPTGFFFVINDERVKEINNLKDSFQNGCDIIAAKITALGVDTAANDSPDDIADKIEELCNIYHNKSKIYIPTWHHNGQNNNEGSIVINIDGKSLLTINSIRFGPHCKNIKGISLQLKLDGRTFALYQNDVSNLSFNISNHTFFEINSGGYLHPDDGYVDMWVYGITIK